MVSMGVLLQRMHWWMGFCCWSTLGTAAYVDDVDVFTIIGMVISTLGRGLLAMMVVSR